MLGRAGLARTGMADAGDFHCIAAAVEILSSELVETGNLPNGLRNARGIYFHGVAARLADEKTGLMVALL